MKFFSATPEGRKFGCEQFLLHCRDPTLLHGLQNGGLRFSHEAIYGNEIPTTYLNLLALLKVIAYPNCSSMYLMHVTFGLRMPRSAYKLH